MHARPSGVRFSPLILGYFSIRQHWMIHPYVGLGRPPLLKSREGWEERRHFKEGAAGAHTISEHLHSLILISLLPPFLYLWLVEEKALGSRVTAGP